MDFGQSPQGQNARHHAGLPSAASSAPQTRPGTSSDSGDGNPFGDGSDSQPATRTRGGNSAINPFSTPSVSRPASSYDSISGAGGRFDERGQRYFHSRRVRKGEVEKPWTKNVDPKEKWVTILPIIGIVVGLAISGFLVWDGIRSVVKHNYCLVLDDDFSRGLDPGIWEHEVQLGGFG